MVSLRRAPPPKRTRTTFGPRKAGFVAGESPASDSPAAKVPPVASRLPPARTPLRKVRRGKVAGESNRFSGSSFIAWFRSSHPARRRFSPSTRLNTIRKRAPFCYKNLLFPTRAALFHPFRGEFV